MMVVQTHLLVDERDNVLEVFGMRMNALNKQKHGKWIAVTEDEAEEKKGAH